MGGERIVVVLCHPEMINAWKTLRILLKCLKRKYLCYTKNLLDQSVAEFVCSCVGLRFLLFDWVFVDRWPLVTLIQTTYVE